MPRPSFDRRDLLGAAGAAMIAPLLADVRPRPAPLQSRWSDAIIINTLGSITNPNQPRVGTAVADTVAPRDRIRRSIDARALREARESGLTAINTTLLPVVDGGDPFVATMANLAAMDGFIREHSDQLLKVYGAGDIERAKRERKVGIIYGTQNTIMLGDDARRIDLVADLGIRVVQLTYNVRNRVGDGALAPDDQGLTPFGHEVVERLNANRVIVDLGHSGRKICLDAARVSKQPIAITHTGCRALADLPRNKSDEELRAVASKGGYVGIYFMSVFLTPTGVAGAADVIAHIEHAIKVCGEDHVGVGTDGSVTGVDDVEAYREAIARDVAGRRAAGVSAPGESSGGLTFVPELSGPTQFYELADLLVQRGHPVSRVEKVLGLNFHRFAREVWGA